MNKYEKFYLSSDIALTDYISWLEPYYDNPEDFRRPDLLEQFLEPLNYHDSHRSLQPRYGVR